MAVAVGDVTGVAGTPVVSVGMADVDSVGVGAWSMRVHAAAMRMKNAATAKVVYRIVSGRDDEQVASRFFWRERGQPGIERGQLALVLHCGREEDGISNLPGAG